MPIFYKVTGPVFICLIIIFSMFIITFSSTSHQKDDGLVINLAGRQRMLTQKMTKELLIFKEQTINYSTSLEKHSTQLENTAKIFEMTLKALINGGKAPLSLNLSKTKYRVCPKASEPAYSQLIKVNNIWTEFSQRLGTIISGNEKDFTNTRWILENNTKLLVEMNKAVVMMQKTSEGKIKKLIQTQAVAVILSIIIIIFSIIFIISIIKKLKNITNILNLGAFHINEASDNIVNFSQNIETNTSAHLQEIQKTTSSLNEIVKSTQDNSKNTISVKNSMDEAQEIVSNNNLNIKELNASMLEMMNASGETSKIIKTIDEIAFQTKILALNAAVEAARAGEAGTGFAVVAKEVGSLAARSSQAAKDTTILIEQTIDAVQKGNSIVKNIDHEFLNVQTIVENSLGKTDNIVFSSKEQMEKINNISQKINDFQNVASENAQTTEKTSHAAQELYQQANTFKEVVDEITYLTGGNLKLKRKTQ